MLSLHISYGLNRKNCFEITIFLSLQSFHFSSSHSLNVSFNDVTARIKLAPPRSNPVRRAKREPRYAVREWSDMSGSQSFSKRSVSNTKRKSKRLHSSRVGDNEGGGRLDLVVLWTRSQRELTETFLVYTSQPFPCSSDIRSVSQTERLGTGYYKPCYLTGQIVQSNAC